MSKTIFIGLLFILPFLVYATEEEDVSVYSEQDIPAIINRPLEVDAGNSFCIDSIVLKEEHGASISETLSAKGVRNVHEIKNRAIEEHSGCFTLGQLQKVADEIELYYRAEGYIFAKVVIPPQTVQDDVLFFQVIKGTLGKVHVVGNRRYSSKILTRPFKSIIGKPLKLKQITSSSLRITDYPGLFSSRLFSSGSSVGESDLEIKVEEERFIYANLRYDNYGYALPGSNRLIADISIQNPTGLADKLDLRYLRQAGGGGRLDAGSLEYSILLPYSFTMGAKYARAQITSPGPGMSDVEVLPELIDVFVENGIIRSRKQNLTLKISGRFSRSPVKINDRRSSRTKTFSIIGLVSYNHVDTLLRGINYIEFEVNHGFPDVFGALPENPADLPLTSRSIRSRVGENRDRIYAGGAFDVFTLRFSRIQTITRNLALNLSAEYQHTNDFLVSPLLYIIGGPNNVRGYQYAEDSAERAFYGSAELVIAPPFIADKEVVAGRSWRELVNIISFYDYVWGKNNYPQNDDLATRAYSSIGAGFRVEFPPYVRSSLTAAWRLQDPYDNEIRKEEPRLWWSISLHY